MSSNTSCEREFLGADKRSKLTQLTIMLSSSRVMCCALASCEVCRGGCRWTARRGRLWKLGCDGSYCTLWLLSLCRLLLRLSHYCLWCVYWCLLLDRPGEEWSGIWVGISLRQALFIILPWFSSRCFGALAGSEVITKCLYVCSRSGVGLTNRADLL